MAFPTLDPVDLVIAEETREQIELVLETLTHREREIIKLRHGLVDGFVYTFEEVGRIFYVTRERARQIEAKAIRKLHHPIRAKRLEAFRGGAGAYPGRPEIEPTDSVDRGWRTVDRAAMDLHMTPSTIARYLVAARGGSRGGCTLSEIIEGAEELQASTTLRGVRTIREKVLRRLYAYRERVEKC